MNWTEANYRAYMARRLKNEPRAREKMQHAKNHTHSEGLRAAVAEPTSVSALDGSRPRKAPGDSRVAPRFKVSFIVRSKKPCDWDNLATIKFLQDGLIDAGIIPEDSWDTVQGQIISEKADSAEDEGTTIIIEQL